MDCISVHFDPFNQTARVSVYHLWAEKYWPIELKGFPNLTRDSGEPLIEKSNGDSLEDTELETAP